LDHYAAVAHPIKLGVGLKDGDRWYEFYFLAPVAPAATLDEYETFLTAYMQERIMELSSAWAAPILANTTQAYQFVAKVRDEEFEIWYIPQELFGDNMLPVAYQDLPKEWVTIPGMETFIAPTFEANGGVRESSTSLERQLTRCVSQIRRILTVSQ
jgi:hypothetical protein